MNLLLSALLSITFSALSAMDDLPSGNNPNIIPAAILHSIREKLQSPQLKNKELQELANTYMIPGLRTYNPLCDFDTWARYNLRKGHLLNLNSQFKFTPEEASTIASKRDLDRFDRLPE